MNCGARSGLRAFVPLLLLAMLSACATAPPLPEIRNPPLAAPMAPVTAEGRPVVALALGGGAARGFAHVGVLKVLDAHHIPVDIVVGTSAGGVAGSLYAAGIRGDAMVRAAETLERDQITDWRIPNRGFIAGESLQDLINRLVEDRPIEALQTRFAAVATDLRTGELVAFTRGNTGLAVRASSSVPGIVQPVSINGREYVDGGLVSQVPVAVARRFGADLVIAVDVTRPPDPQAPLDSTVAVMQQAMRILSKVQADLETASADYVIRPDVHEISLVDFELRARAIEQGMRAAERAIPALRDLITAATARHLSRQQTKP
ncbi:MAG: patatin-like phospholipase family protein [Chromatiales bacterium]